MHRVLLALLLGLLPLPCVAQKPVEVWSYHTSPPFALPDAPGVSDAFVDLLNRHATNAGRFQFKLVQLPRKRLDMRLIENQPGVLLWGTPEFLSEAQSAHATWSRPLLHDQQDFISLATTAYDYQGAESLYGLTLGGVLGHRYTGLDSAIERGLIRREDVHSDLQNLQKLRAGRIDTALLPRSTLLYYRKTDPQRDLYISARPLYQFERRLMLTASLDDAVKAYVREITEALSDNPRWHRLLDRYGLQPIAADKQRR